MWTEWGMEWAAYWLSELALFRLLEYIGKLSIVVAVIFYFLEVPTRRKQVQYDAWRVITSNEGKTGSGGRIQALQDLNNDGVDLTGVDLRMAFLRGVKLQHVTLSWADLTGADLSGAKLVGAQLLGARLSGARLGEADLSGARLVGADLSGANLGLANLHLAALVNTNLSGVNLYGANLSRAEFFGAILEGAGVHGANLSKAVNLTQAQVDSARGDDTTTLPEGVVRPKHWAKTPTK